MKLPLKYIAILVILSLAGIFSYQAYWLGGLYRTMRNDLERNIIEAMRMSDYNEMMLRVERMRKDSADHGTVSVSAGFEKDGKQNLCTQHHQHRPQRPERRNLRPAGHSSKERHPFDEYLGQFLRTGYYHP